MPLIEALKPCRRSYHRRPLKYRRDAVLAWLAEQGLPRTAPLRPHIPADLLTSGKVSLLEQARLP